MPRWACVLARLNSPSRYENGRPHAPDRSRHIALKKPCHLPLKVTAMRRRPDTAQRSSSTARTVSAPTCRLSLAPRSCARRVTRAAHIGHPCRRLRELTPQPTSSGSDRPAQPRAYRDLMDGAVEVLNGAKRQSAAGPAASPQPGVVVCAGVWGNGAVTGRGWLDGRRVRSSGSERTNCFRRSLSAIQPQSVVPSDEGVVGFLGRPAVATARHARLRP